MQIASGTLTGAQSLRGGLFVALGAAILLLPTLMNGFPFVFPDSVDYLTFNYHLIFRSPYYGLFIRLLHLKQFVWLPIAAQTLIVSHLVWTTMRLLLPRCRPWQFMACVVILTLGSSLPVVTGFILADVFTSVMILTLYLLAFHFDRLTSLERIYFFLLACLAISVHLSHLAIALALLLAIGAIFFAQGRQVRSVRMTLAAVAGPIALAAVAILLQNVLIHRVAALSPAGTSFLLANMIEYGPARRYLEEACPAAGYRICAEVGRLPRDSESVLFGTYQRLGGFAAVRAEATTIVLRTIQSRPGEVLEMAGKVAAQAITKRAPGAELVPLQAPNSSFMERALQATFGPGAVRAHLASAQSNDKVPRGLLKIIDNLVFPISLAFLIVATAYAAWRKADVVLALGGTMLAGVVFNILICALTSGAHDRFQARVTWLLPFAALLVLARSMKDQSPAGAERN